MKEELHTYIEPEIEARITALVLGEASEFEVDELERLMEEKPELAIFRRRIEVMHNLLGDAMQPRKGTGGKKDEEWQLSGERREALLKTFSESGPSSRQGEVRGSRTSKGRNQIRAAVVVAACVMFCFIFFMMATPSFRRGEVAEPSSYEESASFFDGSDDYDSLSVLPELDAPSDAFEIDELYARTRLVERKPAAPSSSMSRRIAVNGRSSIPQETEVPIPQLNLPAIVDLGDGDDFGDGWGELDLGGGWGGGDLGGGVDSLGLTGKKAEVAKHDSSVRYRDYVGGGIVSKDFDSDGFVLRDQWFDESGIVSENNGRLSLSLLTQGLRSGDTATTRQSINGILNNPNRTAQPTGENAVPSFTGVWNANNSDWDRLAGGGDDGSRRGEDSFYYSNPEGFGMEGQPELRRSSKGVGNSYAYFSHAASKNFEEGRDFVDREIAGDLIEGELTNVTKGGLKRDLSLYDLGLDDKTKPQTPLNWTAGVSLGWDDDLYYSRETRKFLNPTEYELPEVPNQPQLEERKEIAGKFGNERFKKRKTPGSTFSIGEGKPLKRSIDLKVGRAYRADESDRADRVLRREVGEAQKRPVPSKVGKPVVKSTPIAKPAKLTRGTVRSNDGKLAKLQVELENKDARVAKLRKRLMDVAEKVGLIYVETESGGKTIGDVTALRNVAEKELFEAKKREQELAFQINKLLEVKDDDLMSVASELPDVVFKQAYNKYEDAKSELATMKASGLSERHPDVVMRKTRIKELEKSLKKRAVNVRESLKQSLALAQGQVEKMKKMVSEEQDQGLDKARSLQELNVIRKEYEMARSIRDGILTQYDLERSKAMARGETLKIPSSRSAVSAISSPVKPKVLPDETITATTPFSTFSLNVSDVSFKLAKVALLEKGQWPDAAKVRTEEFVNAFDYGDSPPRRGDPVTCAVEQAAHPFLQQRNLLRVGMKTASVGRSAPLRLTILLDNSGSMEREDREASVLAAIRVLASQLGPQDVITVVGFARQPRLLADRISGDKAHQLVKIVANTPSEGGTNIEEALRLARVLAKRQHTKGAQDRVVLITDGVANLGSTIPDQLSRQIVAMRQEGIAFDACGVGAEGLNDDILEALTRQGDGRYYFLNRAEDADASFAKQLAGALTPAAKNVKVQVKFNPKRVSKYRLLGFEKHRLKKEDFRNDKVDAAEMAAEEAGNAVYQIQVNPQGEGELGEVFVRFLDVSTGRMVERSWPLPYESQAPAFDVAAPSMQLAGTAAMLGEKLHGTDAGSVRFPMISDTLNKLRGHYAADPKVQDLIRMCRKVK